MEYFQQKGKQLYQIDDKRSGPSTSRSKVKSPQKERENFRSTLVKLIMWVLQAKLHVTSVTTGK
jgi:dynein heavy chain